MSNLRSKINERMDSLQEAMEANVHMEDPQQVTEIILSVSKFWSALSEEDREYIQCAQYAIEEKHEWKV